MTLIIIFVQYFINNVFHNLLDYGNENIEKLSVDEDKARSSLLMIDSSIEEKINYRNKFDIYDEGKELSTLKNNRSIDRTSIINISDDIVNRDFRIEELSNKREILSNDVYKTKRYKFKLKEILNNGRKTKQSRVWIRR